ncbi:hypothetical protein KIPB_017099, partial [Kipferlia bialata]
SFSERYLYDGHLGDGSYGDVWRVKDKEDPSLEYAAKIIDFTTYRPDYPDLKEKILKHLPRELSVLSRTHSPYVV